MSTPLKLEEVFKEVIHQHIVHRTDDYERTLAVRLNPDANHGESVILVIDEFDDEDTSGKYYEVSIETLCHGEHNSVVALGNVTPQVLKKAIDMICEKIESDQEGDL